MLDFLGDWMRSYAVGYEIGRAVRRYNGRSYTQILKSAKLLLGNRFGDGDDGILDDSEGVNMRVESVVVAVDLCQ